MGDAERLVSYVDAWAASVEDTVALLRALEPEHWSLPTDLPGWDVRAVAAHLAHLESDLAGNAQEPVEVPELEHIRSSMGVYTERGPLTRREWPTVRIVDELEASAATRLEAFRADPPIDGSAKPPRVPGDFGWDWATLLSNRVIDVWMHQQDIRRAVDRPGGMETAAAAHTIAALVRGFGYTVGKRIAPPAGTSVALEITPPHPLRVVLEINEQGRAVPADVATPTVALRTDPESYIVLAGGRGAPTEVGVTGDHDLGDRVLAAMAVTP